MTGLETLDRFVDARLGGDGSRLLELFETREVYEALKVEARTSGWYHFERKTYDGRYLIETSVGFEVFDQDRGSKTGVQRFGTLREAAQAMFG